MSTHAAVQTQAKPTLTTGVSGVLQRAAVNAAPVHDVPSIVHEVLRSSGQPLDTQTRAFFEPRFGYNFSSVLVHGDSPPMASSNLILGKAGDHYEQEADRVAGIVMRQVKPSNPLASVSNTDAIFSKVRIHTNAHATESARAINAQAYTVGRDIVFGAGQYMPNTDVGKRLIAHELTHVLQQSATGDHIPNSHSAPIGEHVQGHSIIMRQEATFVAGTGNGYLANALRFHQAWGYPNVRRAGTLEEVIRWVSRNIHGVLSRIRIVTHANDTGILVNLLRGYPARRGTTKETLEEVGGGLMPMLSQSAGHVSESSRLDQAFEFLATTPTYREAFQRLAGGSNPRSGSDLHGMVWWMIDRNFVQKVRVKGGLFPNKSIILRLIDSNINLLRSAVETKTALEPGVQATEFAIVQCHSDLQIIVKGIDAFLSGLAWSPISKHKARELGGQISREVGPVRRALAQGLEGDLETMRSLVGLSTLIEIQGCNVGKDTDFLRQFQQFFSGRFRPSVSAPDYFQFFGHPGYQLVQNSDRALENLWHNLSIQQAFIDWWNVNYPSRGGPGLDDFKAYLRAGEIFPTEDRLVTLQPLALEAISEWLARHNYHLTAKDTIRRRFLRGPLAGAISTLWVDWLQDKRDHPTEILFPPDPRYASHITKIPGELGDFEAREEGTRAA